jgi:hypothetical protein
MWKGAVVINIGCTLSPAGIEKTHEKLKQSVPGWE